MAKSRSETRRWIRRGEEKDAWPGQKTHCGGAEILRFTRNRLRNPLTQGSLK